MKIKIKCYVKKVTTPKSTFYARYTFIPSNESTAEHEKKDTLYSVKFTKDVPIPDDTLTRSIIIICDDRHVNMNHNKKEVWITGVISVSPMERPVTDLSQYFEVIDDPKE